MKVGTDGVLLGAWVPAENPRRVLDIGTGTGLIALMMRQRFPAARITALEPHPGAAADARENIRRAAAGRAIDLREITLQDYLNTETEAKFDLIVSNPPFFRNSMPAVNAGRQMARHADSLTCEVLLNAADRLTPDGILAAVYPMEMWEEIQSLMSQRGLGLAAEQSVRPVPHKTPHRILFAAHRRERPRHLHAAEDLSIETGVRHEYTPEFKRLVAPFYLNIEDEA